MSDLVNPSYLVEQGHFFTIIFILFWMIMGIFIYQHFIHGNGHLWFLNFIRWCWWIWTIHPRLLNVWSWWDLHYKILVGGFLMFVVDHCDLDHTLMSVQYQLLIIYSQWHLYCTSIDPRENLPREPTGGRKGQPTTTSPRKETQKGPTFEECWDLQNHLEWQSVVWIWWELLLLWEDVMMVKEDLEEARFPSNFWDSWQGCEWS